MKIAIVAPCPKPFVMGGAEKLWAGMRRYLNERTRHEAEIIKLSVSEASFWDLAEGYEAFARLDLSGFDAIVSTKYPSWMVSHRQHSVYVAHACRGLYEFYDRAPYDAAEWRRVGDVDRVVATLRRHPGDERLLEEVFDAVRRWRADPAIACRIAWPGPVAREIVHFLDSVGLSSARIRRYAAISNTVKARPGYFPVGVEVHVAWPPASFAPAAPAQAAIPYFFTSSRLDTNKRVDLIVRAWREVRGDCELRIAGTGPLEEQLKALAEADARVRFLGFLSDDELAAQYAGCRAVPFVPYQEDYGLIAVEAMAAGKAVLTASDSGGPTELVIDGVTGLVVAPEPGRLAGAMQRLLDDPEHAAALGAAGRQRHGDTISWAAVVSAATGLPPEPIFGTRGLPKIVVAMTFAFFPPRHGGQTRVYNLYRSLARHFDVAIVCLVPFTAGAGEREVAPGLREIRVPQARAHARQEARWQGELGVPVADISALMLHEETPEFAAALARECAGAAAVVCCHPYFGPLLRDLFDGPLWYEAQDVEVDIKTALLPRDNLLAKRLIEATREAEAFVCEHAQWIWPCSAVDAERLTEVYGVTPERIVVVPNGTDVASYRYRIGEERAVFRERLLGSDKTTLALFMGSGHQPNIDGLRMIIQCAPRLPETRFVIMGSVCYAIDPKTIPENVWFLGEVSETERHVILELADLALNPIASGSGTNLKMLDYFAAGLPVLTSRVGARGLAVVDGEHCLIREMDPLDDFIEAVRRLGRDAALCKSLAVAARKHVEEHFDWERIAQRLLASVTGATPSGVAQGHPDN